MIVYAFDSYRESKKKNGQTDRNYPCVKMLAGKLNSRARGGRGVRAEKMGK